MRYDNISCTYFTCMVLGKLHIKNQRQSLCSIRFLSFYANRDDQRSLHRATAIPFPQLES
jgi:hypothetical protein